MPVLPLYSKTIQGKMAKWTVDTIHSLVQFKVKHLAIATVSGTFKMFSGDVVSEDDNFSNAAIHFTVDANSIDTHHPDRDGHLKSPDFFHTAQFPAITFDGKLTNNQLTGELTIRGVSKSITMDVEFGGVGKGRFGDTRAGFEVDGKINRKDFGLTWSMLTEAGGLVVGEDIKMHFDIELILA
jgi:polyisoprenoid-binding protein YceI